MCKKAEIQMKNKKMKPLGVFWESDILDEFFTLVS